MNNNTSYNHSINTNNNYNNNEKNTNKFHFVIRNGVLINHESNKRRKKYDTLIRSIFENTVNDTILEKTELIPFSPSKKNDEQSKKMRKNADCTNGNHSNDSNSSFSCFLLDPPGTTKFTIYSKTKPAPKKTTENPSLHINNNNSNDFDLNNNNNNHNNNIDTNEIDTQVSSTYSNNDLNFPQFHFPAQSLPSFSTFLEEVESMIKKTT